MAHFFVGHHEIHIHVKLNCTVWVVLTHWGRVTHICVDNLSIIGSDNGLSPGRRQAIIWTNAAILLIEPLGTNFSEILIEILTSSAKKMHLKMSSGNWRPFCLGLNVLTSNDYYIEMNLKHQSCFTPVVSKSACDWFPGAMTWSSFSHAMAQIKASNQKPDWHKNHRWGCAKTINRLHRKCKMASTVLKNTHRWIFSWEKSQCRWLPRVCEVHMYFGFEKNNIFCFPITFRVRYASSFVLKMNSYMYILLSEIFGRLF